VTATTAPLRLPLVPTLLVGLAVAVMIALGIWQLGRAEWKAELLERYSGAQALSSEVAWPRSPAEVEASLYRHSSFTCDRVLGIRATAGRSAEGASGWAQVASCALDGGGEAEVALGWTDEPIVPQWSGGYVVGFVAPAGEGARLVAAPAQAGLAPLAPPDPADLPNNHLAYAGQWFFFAATALVVYWLALRRRWRGVG
jgi:surfeit locus 1 family protein